MDVSSLQFQTGYMKTEEQFCSSTQSINKTGGSDLIQATLPHRHIRLRTFLLGSTSISEEVNEFRWNLRAIFYSI